MSAEGTVVGRKTVEHSALKIGFLVNPIAGIGGPLGMKGSDHVVSLNSNEHIAKSREEQRSFQRAKQCLSLIQGRVEFVSAPSVMGEDLLHELGFDLVSVVGEISKVTSACDTQSIVEAMCNIPLDLLVFVGGDGTARDICSAVRPSPPV